MPTFEEFGSPKESTHIVQAVPSYLVLSGRKRTYRVALSSFLNLITVVLVLFGFSTLAVVGEIPLMLWRIFSKAAVSPLEAIVSFVPLTIALGYYAVRVMQREIEGYVNIRAFTPLYQHCRYIDPSQMVLFRLPYPVISHPDRFTYAFAGAKFILLVEKQKAQNTSYSIIEEDDEFQERDNENPLNVSVENIPMVVAETSDLAELTHEAEPVWQKNIVQEEQEPSISRSNTIEEENLRAFLQRFRPVVKIEQKVSLLVEEITKYGEEKRKPVRVSLHNNSDYKALLAYLGTREKEEWVNHDVLKEKLYTEKASHIFYDSRRRVQKSINESIEKEFPQWTPIPKNFTLFEQEGKRGNVRWRLSSICCVTGFHLLDQWYQKIQSNSLIRENELIPEATKLIKHYSNNYLTKYTDHEAYTGGYLIEHLEEESFKNWAYNFFEEYRRKYIFVLTYIAERIYKIGLDKKKQEDIEQAAKFYRECAYAATCNPINHAQGEAALRSCIESFISNGQSEDAEMTAGIYAKRVKKMVVEFKPEIKTQQMMDRYNLSFE